MFVLAAFVSAAPARQSNENITTPTHASQTMVCLMRSRCKPPAAKPARLCKGVVNTGHSVLALLQLPGLLPFQDQFAKALHGWRILILLPDQDERNALHRLQQNK